MWGPLASKNQNKQWTFHHCNRAGNNNAKEKERKQTRQGLHPTYYCWIHGFCSLCWLKGILAVGASHMCTFIKANWSILVYYVHQKHSKVQSRCTTYQILGHRPHLNYICHFVPSWVTPWHLGVQMASYHFGPRTCPSGQPFFAKFVILTFRKQSTFHVVMTCYDAWLIQIVCGIEKTQECTYSFCPYHTQKSGILSNFWTWSGTCPRNRIITSPGPGSWWFCN